MKELGAGSDKLLQVYQRKIRSILELAAPAWHSGLTVADRRKIEREQKKCFAVILGKNFNSYENALKTLGQGTLEKIRENLNLKFATKCLKSPVHHKMFPKANRPILRHSKIYKEYQCFAMVESDGIP